MASKPRTKITYGYQQYRFKDNPEERRFSLAWHKQQAGRTLAHLLSKPHHGFVPPDPSDVDNHVAATVIQWLGSPVGQCFLRDLGYMKKRVVPTTDSMVKNRERRVGKMKDRVFRIRQILLRLDTDLLNIDNPHG
jgi:hypothetical protein